MSKVGNTKVSTALGVSFPTGIIKFKPPLGRIRGASVIGALAVALSAHAASASCSLTYPLLNGTAASGSQVIQNFTDLENCYAPINAPALTGDVGVGLSAKAGGQAFDQALNVNGNIYFSNSSANASRKTWNIVGAPYYSVNPGGDEDISYISGTTTSSAYPVLLLGGGTAGNTAVQNVEFYTGSSYNTDTGTLRMTIAGDGGLYMAGATGGSEGAGTINATTVYANGVALTSDRRHKFDIQPLSQDALALVERLKPVTFLWKEPKDDEMKGRQIGFIAQDVQPVIPGIVSTQKNAEKTLGIKYEQFIPILTRAIQQQQFQIAALRAEVDALKPKKARQTSRN